MVDRTPTGRGQLILIGALLLATVIFGLSMLLNSMLFTGAAGGSGASAALEETGHIDYDVEQGMRELVVRLNHGDRNRSARDVGDAVNASTLHYSQALTEARARSGSVAVAVRYNNSTSEFGGRIVQDHNADMSDPDGSLVGWEPVPDTANARVGWFSLSADVENTTSGFQMEAENATDSVTINLERNGSQIDVRSTASFTGATPDSEVSCDSERGRVILDLYVGSGFTGDCSFVGIGALETPTSIEFDNGDELEGKYAIVTNRSLGEFGSTPDYDHCNGLSPNEAEPCVAPAIWSANISTSVEGASVSYDDTYNLTVYTNER